MAATEFVESLEMAEPARREAALARFIEAEIQSNQTHAQLVSRWRDLSKRLREWKSEGFPSGAVVYVHCQKYTGYGIVVLDDECPDDQVAVRIENGNVWWYPVDRMFRIRNLKLLPRAVRRRKLRHAGIKCEAVA